MIKIKIYILDQTAISLMNYLQNNAEKTVVTGKIMLFVKNLFKI